MEVPLLKVEGTIDEFLTFNLPNGMTSADVTLNVQLTGSIINPRNIGVSLELMLGSESSTLTFSDYTIPGQVSLTETVTDGQVVFFRTSFAPTIRAGISSFVGEPGSMNITLQYSIDTPSGVTFTSDSGVFVGSADLTPTSVNVPFPLWTLLILSLFLSSIAVMLLKSRKY